MAEKLAGLERIADSDSDEAILKAWSDAGPAVPAAKKPAPPAI